jgi:hypothetical protein
LAVVVLAGALNYFLRSKKEMDPIASKDEVRDLPKSEDDETAVSDGLRQSRPWH